MLGRNNEWVVSEGAAADTIQASKEGVAVPQEVEVTERPPHSTVHSRIESRFFPDDGMNPV